tara:strand:- start:191 stop:457 length:267 start_codon:yes stop_codon:yes gene_type:complete
VVVLVFIQDLVLLVQVQFLARLLQQVVVKVLEMELEILEVQVQVVALKVEDLTQGEQVILHQLVLLKEIMVEMDIQVMELEVVVLLEQ